MKKKLSLFFILLIVSLVYPFSPVHAQDELPQFPMRNYWTRVTPSVFYCDDPDGMTVEVHIVGRTDVTRVLIRNPLGDTMEQNGPFMDPFSILYDDGTNGDAVAGDNVFTRSGLQPYCPEKYMENWGYGTWDYYPNFDLKNGTTATSWYPIRIGLVDPKYRGAFEVKDLGNGLSATAYAFFIQDSNFEVINAYPVANIYCGLTNFEAYRKLYSVLPDEFDIAMVTPGMQLLQEREHLENIPYAIQVSNDIQNIGLEIQDDAAEFGSAGRLRTVIYNSFGGLDVVDHELGHVWGVGLGSKLRLASMDQVAQVYSYHWNPKSDIGGQMQYFHLTPSGEYGKFSYNGDETWRFVKNIDSEMNEPYSPLELYAMGLIGPDEVPPVHLFTSPPVMDDPERVTFAAYTTITIEDIIKSEGGERIPSVADSQKDFTLAYIVTQDIPYDDAAYVYHSLMAYHLTTKEPPETHTSAGELSQFRYIMPFYWATGGRATLETRLPVDVSDPVGLPYMPVVEIEPTSTPEPANQPAIIEDTPTQPANSSSEEQPVSQSPSGCSLLPVGLVFLPGMLSWRKRKKE